MFTIGQLSTRTGVKVPTIRYYEGAGLMPEAERTAGNQRRYDQAGLERLGFIRHARDLGFSIETIAQLIGLGERPDRSCAVATGIARTQLTEVRAKIARLTRLEQELARIAEACSDDEDEDDVCRVLTALGDHRQCAGGH